MKNYFETIFSSVFLHSLFIVLIFIGGLSQVKKLQKNTPSLPVINVDLTQIKIAKESSIPNLKEEVKKLEVIEKKIDEKLKKEQIKKEELRIEKRKKKKLEKKKKEIKKSSVKEKTPPLKKKTEQSSVPASELGSSKKNIPPKSEVSRPTRRKKIENSEHKTKISSHTLHDLSLSVRDALRVRIRQCWMIDPSRNYPKGMQIRVTAFLQQNGTVYKTLAPTASDSLSNYLIGTAVRAIKVCSPFDFLPVEQYDQWKEIEITFDPANGNIK